MIPHGLFCYAALRRSAPRDSVFRFLYKQSDKTFSVAYAPLCVSGRELMFAYRLRLRFDACQLDTYTLCLLFVQLIHHAPKLAPANLQDDRL